MTEFNPETSEPTQNPPKSSSLERKKPTDEQILATYSPDAQATIRSRLNVLSSIGHHVGKDMTIKMGLSEPGKREWYQDPTTNSIKADPDALLEGNMELMRFAMAHEGGHRRITRVEGIPKKTLQSPGFAFLMNAVEDPRNNNFIVEGYPILGETMPEIIEEHRGFKREIGEDGKRILGQNPRFAQAGLEYIYSWMLDRQDLPMTVDEGFPPDVQDVLQATLPAAQNYWWTYPTKVEADSGEATILTYSATANNILLERIWPEYQRLVEEDIKDQMLSDVVREYAKQKQQEINGSSNDGDHLSPNLTPDEQAELEQAIADAIDRMQNGDDSETQAGESKPIVIDIDTLSDALKQKIKDYLESLDEETATDLRQKASDELTDFEKKIVEQQEGMKDGSFEQQIDEATHPAEAGAKRADDVSGSEQESTHEELANSDELAEEGVPSSSYDPEMENQLSEIRQRIESLTSDETPYSKARDSVAPVIDRVANDLEQIFVDRRTNTWTGGHRSGKRLDITRRMREKGRQRSAAESRAWERRELPTETDYAFSILVDLSGSMRGLVDYSSDYDTGALAWSEQTKIYETFKAAIVTGEVLDRLHVPNEILGFNAELHVFKTFDQSLDKNIRAKISTMLEEVRTFNAMFNDDGWALKAASDRLAAEQADEKYVIVLSDGQPEPSALHGYDTYDLNKIVTEITKNTDQVLIGMGIQSDAVKDFYPNAIVENDAAKLSLGLSTLLEDIINNPTKYKVN